MHTLRELRARRHDLVAEAARLADQPRLSRDDEARYNEVLNELENLDREIEREERRLEVERAAAAAEFDRQQREGFRRGDAAPPDDSLGAPAWRSARGDVRALAPAESFRAYVAARTPDAPAELRELRFGDVVRAMVTGPRSEAERRALAEGSDSAGGVMAPTITSAMFIDRLRAATVTVRAGARTVPLEAKETTIARLDADPTATWSAEGASLPPETDMAFSGVVLTPKTLRGIVLASRELIEDAPNAADAIERAFAAAMAVQLDRAALFGGGGNEPTGVVNVPGVAAVDMGANGAPLTSYAPLLQARGALLAANAGEPTAFIMAPRTATELASLVDSTGQPLRIPPAIERVPLLATTSVPTDETHGTATNASRIVTGNFPELLIGMRSEVRVELLRERYAEEFRYGFLCYLRADVAVAHPASFAVVAGVIPPA